MAEPKVDSSSFSTISSGSANSPSLLNGLHSSLRSSSLDLPPPSSVPLTCGRDPPIIAVAEIPLRNHRQCPSVLFGNRVPSRDVLDTWLTANAVCFDVDSTVCVDEGIDELAEFCGAGEAVAKLTKRAMGGCMPLQEALAARLNLFKPTLSQLNDYLEKRPPRMSPGIAELVKTLMDMNMDVYLVSGGFRQMLKPVAALLGIPEENIYGNQLLFGSSGEYMGFDTKEPTSKTGGKAVAVEMIKKKHDYEVVIMVGDGATDLEAGRDGAADLFICCGGAQLRQSVATRADWLVLHFQELIEPFSIHNEGFL